MRKRFLRLLCVGIGGIGGIEKMPGTRHLKYFSFAEPTRRMRLSCFGFYTAIYTANGVAIVDG